jgi:hypothetical protein
MLWVTHAVLHVEVLNIRLLTFTVLPAISMASMLSCERQANLYHLDPFGECRAIRCVKDSFDMRILYLVNGDVGLDRCHSECADQLYSNLGLDGSHTTFGRHVIYNVHGLSSTSPAREMQVWASKSARSALGTSEKRKPVALWVGPLL